MHFKNALQDADWSYDVDGHTGVEPVSPAFGLGPTSSLHLSSNSKSNSFLPSRLHTLARCSAFWSQTACRPQVVARDCQAVCSRGAVTVHGARGYSQSELARLSVYCRLLAGLAPVAFSALTLAGRQTVSLSSQHPSSFPPLIQLLQGGSPPLAARALRARSLQRVDVVCSLCHLHFCRMQKKKYLHKYVPGRMHSPTCRPAIIHLYLRRFFICSSLSYSISAARVVMRRAARAARVLLPKFHPRASFPKMHTYACSMHICLQSFSYCRSFWGSS